MTSLLSHEYITETTISFTQAFNENNLDMVMSYFAEAGSIYDQFDGTRAEGLADIRKALVPQFRGDFGLMQFLEEEMFCDAQNMKSLIAWTCSLKTSKGPGHWRGLDILHFNKQGKILIKKTYAKAASLKIISEV